MTTAISYDTVLQRVIQLAADQVGADPATVTPDTQFFADLNYDSLDMVEFVMEVEDAYDITIPDVDVEPAKTVGQAAELIHGLLCNTPSRQM